MEFASSTPASSKGSSYGDYLNPRTSKLENQLRAKRLTSEDTIRNLIKMLEIQLQRIDVSVSLDINSDDPLLRVVEAVKTCVDEINDVKERLKMNSFVSNHSELDRSQSQQDLSFRATAEKLTAANKQLKHFERLLSKKEKNIIEKEKNLSQQLKELEKEKEQIELTKHRLKKLEESGLSSKIHFTNDEDTVKSLAFRLSIEKQALEAKKVEIAEHLKILEDGIERIEREKLENNDLIEENKKLLETLAKERQEVQETKRFIEKQKNEMQEIKSNNEKLLTMVSKERANLKLEEEKILKLKFDHDAKVVYFNREKNDFSKTLAEVESERNKLSKEKDQLNKFKQKILDEKDLLKQEFSSLEEIKEQLSLQNRLEIESKERILQQREEELENSIIDLKIQVENYNCQIDERENLLKEREENIQLNEQKIRVGLANIRLAEMSLIESKSQAEEIMQSLIPNIENCYEELQGILKDSFENKLSIEKALSAGPGKFVCAHCNYSITQDHRDSQIKENLEQVNSEIQAKIRFLTGKEEETRLLELKNIATADRLQRALDEFEEKKKKYQDEMAGDKDRLKKNFAQLDNSLKMIKEKEAELNLMKSELVEREKILRAWEKEFKQNN
jgi:hypothetical protein